MKLIAFVAPKEYGKTTACNILKEYYGSDNVVQVNFKDGLIAELKQNFPDLLRAIYNAEQELYSYPPESIDGLFINKSPLVRTLMQNYGTEVRRKDRETYWIDKWSVNTFIASMIKNKIVLTDDCRFLNEAKAIKEAGGVLIRLNRTDKTNTDTHPSEQEQKDIVCDYEITVGEGEIDILKEKLIKIAEVL